MKLQTQNICKSFDGTEVLHNISIEVNSGEIVCLLGHSGGGKSTLFNVISGLLSPENGSVLLDGEDVTSKSGKISYMLQKDLLLPYRTVLDNVALPLLIRGEDRASARKAAAAHFEQFGLLGHEEKYPAQLSGGMRQRAALLRTYLFSGSAALLDEPFSALDTLTKSGMHSWYLQVMEDIRLTTLFITHDIDEGILLSDRIYILSGSPATITSEIKIDVPKPRHRDFPLSEEFLQFKKQISAAMNLI